MAHSSPHIFIFIRLLYIKHIKHGVSSYLEFLRRGKFMLTFSIDAIVLLL